LISDDLDVTHLDSLPGRNKTLQVQDEDVVSDVNKAKLGKFIEHDVQDSVVAEQV
jgi:hypothetical protein